jgi:hypothetical protein
MVRYGWLLGRRPPAIPNGDRIWIEYDAPVGAATFAEMYWDQTQKASGTRSSTRPLVPGAKSLIFSDATATMTPGHGETLVFYALLHACASPQSLRVIWQTTDGFTAGRVWGLTTTGGQGDAPLPPAGSWARYEVSAQQLGLEFRAIKTIQFSLDDGQVWIDHVGIGPADCYPAASPPTLGTETVWMDDAIPAGASPFGAPQWDATQKASGSQSMTREPQTGVTAYGFQNATAGMLVGWGQSLVFYTMTNECAPPQKIVAQWVATDGSEVHHALIASAFVAKAAQEFKKYEQVSYESKSLCEAMAASYAASLKQYMTDGSGWSPELGKDFVNAEQLYEDTHHEGLCGWFNGFGQCAY